MTLTAERARELLRYDPGTGVVTWRVFRKALARAGDECRSRDRDGYLIVSLDGKSHSLARVIFFMQTGRWPTRIDHINRIKTDNRWLNLRDSSAAESLRNRRGHAYTASGFKGVWRVKSGRWKATIYVDNVCRYLGTYDAMEEAARAYDKAARELHGDFACTNEMLGLLPKISEAA